MPHKRPTLKEQQQSVELWNLKHAVGCAVTVELDSGEIRATRTRSLAQMSQSGDAVIFLDSFLDPSEWELGYCLLSRVRAKMEVTIPRG